LQVGGLIRLTFGAVLSFGLAHYGSSEFELMAEELLMSDSVVKASRTIRPLSKNFRYRVYYSFPCFPFFFSFKNHILQTKSKSY